MDIYVLAKVAGTTSEIDEMQLNYNAIGAYTTEDKAKKTLAILKQQLIKEFQYPTLKTTTIGQDTPAKFSIMNTRRGKVTTIKIQKVTIE